MGEVDVQSRAHALAKLVLQVGELLAEIAHMVIVDERQSPHGVDPFGHLGPGHRGPGQIAQQLGPRAVPFV